MNRCNITLYIDHSSYSKIEKIYFNLNINSLNI